MVEISCQHHTVRGGKDLHPVKRESLEVEGLHKLLLEAAGGNAFLKFLGFNHGLCGGRHGKHFSVLLLKAYVKAGMCLQDLFNGVFNGFGRSSIRETPQHGDVVLGFPGGLHAVKENALLLEGEFMRLNGYSRGGRCHSLLLSGHKHLQDLVLYALERGGFCKAGHVGLQPVFLIKLRCKAQGAQGTHSVIEERLREAEAVYVGGFTDDSGNFLFKDVEGGSAFSSGGLCRGNRLRKGPPVHFLVYVQRNGVYLHGDGGHHVRRLSLCDECVKRLNVNGVFGHNVCGDELPAAAFLVKGLHGDILDAGILPYHAFNFF